MRKNADHFRVFLIVDSSNCVFDQNLTKLFRKTICENERFALTKRSLYGLRHIALVFELIGDQSTGRQNMQGFALIGEQSCFILSRIEFKKS